MYLRCLFLLLSNAIKEIETKIDNASILKKKEYEAHMTAEGKIVRTKYDKYRQINRFLEFIEDVLPHLPKDREITILDFGCGKSYLTFAMYYYLKELKGYDIRIIKFMLAAWDG